MLLLFLASEDPGTSGKTYEQVATQVTCRIGQSRAWRHVAGRASHMTGALWVEAQKGGVQGRGRDSRLAWWENKVKSRRVMGDRIRETDRFIRTEKSLKCMTGAMIPEERTTCVPFRKLNWTTAHRARWDCIPTGLQEPGRENKCVTKVA